MSNYDLSAFSTTFKEVYLPGIHEQTKRQSNVLKSLDENKSKIDLTNLEARFNIELSPGHNVGSRWEAEAYPDSIAPTRKEAVLKLKKLTAQIDVTPESVKRSASDDAAYAAVLEERTRGIATQIGRDRAAQVLGLGSGVRAVCGTTTAANVVVLATSTTAAQMRAFYRNQLVDIGTAGSPASIASARQITAVNVSGKTITISGAAVTTSGTSNVSIAGSGGSSAWDTREVTSLQQITAATGSLYGVDPSVDPEHAGTVNSNGGTPRTFTNALVERQRDDIRVASGETPTIVFTSPGVLRHATAQLTATLQYAMDDLDSLKSGVKAVLLGGIPVVSDDYVFEGTALFLNTESPAGVSVATTGLEDVSNGFQVQESGDILRAKVRQYWEVTTQQRNLHGRVTDLTEA